VLNFPPVPQSANPASRFGTAIVREFGCPTYACDGRIVYRPSPEEVAFYEYHRWATDPRTSITQLMIESLRAQSLFRRVALHDSGAEAAYILTGNIQRLEEVDAGRDVRAVCVLSAQLIDAQSGSVVWSDTQAQTVAVEQRDIPGVVRGLSAAAQAAASGLVKSMSAQLTAAR
jgi:ABC-type uncharacterized transport system auxiliary subunit